MAHFVVQSSIRKAIKEQGRRLGKDYLASLDSVVYDIIRRSCVVHNGGKKTLDASILAHVVRAIGVR